VVYLRVLFWDPYHILLKNKKFKYSWGKFSEIIENIIWFKFQANLTTFGSSLSAVGKYFF